MHQEQKKSRRSEALNNMKASYPRKSYHQRYKKIAKVLVSTTID